MRGRLSSTIRLSACATGKAGLDSAMPASCSGTGKSAAAAMLAAVTPSRAPTPPKRQYCTDTCHGRPGSTGLTPRELSSAGEGHPPRRDRPHATPRPRGGGVGIVAARLRGTAMLWGLAQSARLGDGYFRGVIAAAALIAVVSFV